MILERHELIESDIERIVLHIIESTGFDYRAAKRREQEISDLIAQMMSNPLSGTRLDGRLTGCLVRHGGSGMMLTIVFKPIPKKDRVRLILVGFGGWNWLGHASERV